VDGPQDPTDDDLNYEFSVDEIPPINADDKPAGSVTGTTGDAKKDPKVNFSNRLCNKFCLELRKRRSKGASGY
jgi:P pilus assembly chaperone PapD